MIGKVTCLMKITEDFSTFCGGGEFAYAIGQQANIDNNINCVFGGFIL